ncbi:carbohydrate esterase family 4 protein [Mycena filopes]|nr:carbohydrate esterase family 4 protein [Mycena filopes]
MLLGKTFALLLAAILASAATLTERAPDIATVYSKCVNPNHIALTFDDGPWNYETELVNYLNNNNVKGTFFVNGNNYGCIYDVETADTLTNTFKAGHEVLSHTWSHPHLKNLTDSQIAVEISRLDTAFKKVLGIVPKLLRPPYGEYNDDVRTVAAAQGKDLVVWDFDSLDSDGASAAKSKKLYDAKIAKKPSTLLALNHETEVTTVRQVIPYVVPKLLAAGYEMVTVSECLGVDPYSFVGSPGTRDNDTWTCE